jgi:transmembrane sensor
MKEDICELIAKHFTGETGTQEEIALNEWLKVESNKEEFILLKNDWIKRMEKNTFNSDKAWENVKKGILEAEKVKTRRMVFTYSSIAALLIVGILLFVPTLNSGKEIMIVAEANEIQQVTLHDGSVVHLNAGSKLSYPKKFKAENREVSLSGEAFFNVSKNKQKPFIVRTNRVTIQVLGTSFNVNNNKGNSCEVIVSTGKVEVLDNISNESVTLVKNERAVSRNGVLKKHTELNKNALAWRTKEFSFSAMPLHEVVSIIAEAYNTSIELQIGENCNFELNSEYSDMNVETILESISKAFNLSLAKENEKYILSGSNCP